MNSTAAYTVAAAEVAGAFIMLIVSLRAAHPTRPATVALAIGLLAGAALTLILEQVF